MELSIRSQHMKVHPSLREAITVCSRLTLSRFSRSIRSVDVQLADLNGPRGGVDKRCRIAVLLEPKGTVLLEDKDPSIFAAVTKAFHRAARAVARMLARQRDRRKRFAAADKPHSLAPITIDQESTT